MENKNSSPAGRSDSNSTYWIIALVFLLIGAWPVSAIMAALKLFGGKKNSSPARTESRTAAPTRTARNPYSATTSQKYTGSRSHPYTSTIHYEAQAQRSTATANPENGNEAASDKKNKLKKLSASGRLQRILGIVFAVIGFISLSEPISQLLSYGISSGWMEDLLTALGIAICGGVLFGIGVRKQRTTHRMQSYLNVVNGERIVLLSELADVAGVSVYRVTQDVQQMIADGSLPEGAYVDHKRKCLVLDASTMQNYREKENAAKQDDPTRIQPADDSSSDAKKAVQETEYERILREIRQANDDIDDAAMSAKIDRIEQLSRSIFGILEEKPERRTDARSFFNYYLPTTQKLLDFYAKLEDQPLQEGSIEDSRRNIEGIMDNLVKGFEAQLDSLFRSEAMDITTEISVLENMLNRDGIVTTPSQQAISQAVADAVRPQPGSAAGSSTAVETAPLPQQQ